MQNFEFPPDMLFTSASVVSLFFYATQMVKKFMLFSASFSQILDVVIFFEKSLQLSVQDMS